MKHRDAAALPGPVAWMAKTLATVMGVGYLPVAPGTWGSLAAIPLVMGASQLTLPAYAAMLIAATALSVGVASLAERAFASHDSSHVVLDEVVGMLWTFFAVPVSAPWLISGFILFRVFDALKPGPIRWLDNNVMGGFGVIIDDVAAGIVSCALLHVAMRALVAAA